MWDQKCLIWVLLGENFKKTIVIFEISTLKCVKLQNFVKKMKIPKFGYEKMKIPKSLNLPYLGIFGLEFKNNVVIFEISTLEFV